MFENAITIVGTAAALVVVVFALLVALACLRGIVYAIVEYPVLFLLLAALAVMAIIGNTKAGAQNLHLPPAEFDKPYPGKLTIDTVTPEQLLAQCATATRSSLGCSFPGSVKNCRIILLEERIINAAGWTVELMLRHETAHCNGWPGNHPGKRPYP